MSSISKDFCFILCWNIYIAPVASGVFVVGIWLSLICFVFSQILCRYVWRQSVSAVLNDPAAVSPPPPPVGPTPASTIPKLSATARTLYCRGASWLSGGVQCIRCGRSLVQIPHLPPRRDLEQVIHSQLPVALWRETPTRYPCCVGSAPE